jgi:RimJ/RimL family protein N-acetyltransferase
MRNYNCLKRNIFESNGFSLVPIRGQDKFMIMQMRNEQIYHLRQNKLITAQDQINYFSNVVSKLFDNEQPNQILFSFLENDIFIGYGGLVHINWVDKNAEISFIMKTELENEYFSKYWSIYLQLIEQVAFEELNLHKIFVYAFDLRPYLYETLEENNFIREAELKEHSYYNNQFINVVIHSKLNNK